MQEFIVYIIIACVAFVVVRSFIGKIRVLSKKNATACDACPLKKSCVPKNKEGCNNASC